MIVKTLEEIPADATHWSTRSVLCVDEKSQIQALDRTAPVLPLLPGVAERRSHDYVRNGTTNLYAALNVASGQVIADTTARHRAEEFQRFLNLIDRSVPERWFAELTTKRIKRGTHRSVRELVSSIRTWINTWKDGPSPWSGTRQQTRSSTASPPTAKGSTTQVTSASDRSASEKQHRVSLNATGCRPSNSPPNAGRGQAPGAPRSVRSRGVPNYGATPFTANLACGSPPRSTSAPPVAAAPPPWSP